MTAPASKKPAFRNWEATQRVRDLIPTLQKAGLDGHHYLVLQAIAEHVNKETGTAWPSLDTIAGLTFLSRRRVIEKVGDLVSAGFLRRDKSPVRKNGCRSNVYRVLTPKDELGDKISHGGIPLGDDSSHGGCNSVTQPGDTISHEEKEPEKKIEDKEHLSIGGATAAPQKPESDKEPGTIREEKKVGKVSTPEGFKNELPRRNAAFVNSQNTPSSSSAETMARVFAEPRRFDKSASIQACWKEKTAVRLNQPTATLTKEQAGQLTHIAKKLDTLGVDPVTVIDWVFDNWWEFSHHGGSFGPTDPHPGYVLTHVNDLSSLYRTFLGRQAEEAALAAKRAQIAKQEAEEKAKRQIELSKPWRRYIRRDFMGQLPAELERLPYEPRIPSRNEIQAAIDGFVPPNDPYGVQRLGLREAENWLAVIDLTPEELDRAYSKPLWTWENVLLILHEPEEQATDSLQPHGIVA